MQTNAHKGQPAEQALRAVMNVVMRACLRSSLTPRHQVDWSIALGVKSVLLSTLIALRHPRPAQHCQGPLPTHGLELELTSRASTHRFGFNCVQHPDKSTACTAAEPLGLRPSVGLGTI
jgi:hypothetical protein